MSAPTEFPSAVAKARFVRVSPTKARRVIKVTGAHSNRREGACPGDVVTVTRIDRLARSTFDLFAIVKQIVDAKAQFRSLAEPWADSSSRTGRLMLAVLGGLADVGRMEGPTGDLQGRVLDLDGARAALAREVTT